MTCKLSPKELDDQCDVKIDKWMDLYSTEIAVLDPDVDLARKWYQKLSGEEDGLFCDSNGRIFGGGKNGKYFPFHFEHGNKLIGYKISKKAAN